MMKMQEVHNEGANIVKNESMRKIGCDFHRKMKSIQLILWNEKRFLNHSAD